MSSTTDIVKTITVDSSCDNDYCSICLTDITSSDNSTLKCSHKYHTECYTSYIAYNIVHKKENIACPVCRDNILQIVIDKPQTVHIITGDNDIESNQPINEARPTTNNPYHGYSFCAEFSHRMACATIKIGMLYVLFLIIYYTLYCTQTDVC